LARILALMLMSLVLAACGGGGGDTGGSGGGGGGAGGGGSSGGSGGGGGGGGANNPPPNNTPTVTLTSFSVDQDSDLGGTMTATDPENDALTFAKKTDPFAWRPRGISGERHIHVSPDSGLLRRGPLHDHCIRRHSQRRCDPQHHGQRSHASSSESDPDGDALKISCSPCCTMGLRTRACICSW
jgi:hypothetical protein